MSVPHTVRGMCRTLYRATGRVAEVALQEDGSWEVAMRTDRVAMVGYYEPLGRGEYRWNRSTLTIDGQPVGTCEDARHLARIILDPDPHLRDFPIEPDLRVGLTPRDAHDAPAAVRHMWLSIEGNIGPGTTAEIGLIKDNWVISISVEDRWIVMTWEQVRGDWVRSRQHIRVMVEGQIMTLPENEIERAMALLLGHNRPEEAAPASPIAGPARPARTNSVEVRRASVIRN